MMSNNNDQSQVDASTSLDRHKLDVQVDALVQHEGIIFRIQEILNFEMCIGTNVETGRSNALRIAELKVPDFQSDNTDSQHEEIEDISDERWKVGQKNYSNIKPLLNRFDLTKADVEKRAEEVGVSASTLYKWKKIYESTGSIECLIPSQRGWVKGNSRLSTAVTKIIEDKIQNYYLTTQKPTVQKTYQAVKAACIEVGLPVPSAAAVWRRIDALPQKVKWRKRGNKKKAEDVFMPTPGKFPGADFPLSVVQIDHTEVDIILVDDEHRRPVGRPWITLAIDVNTRTVPGYYLSFDPPSSTSVGMCISHSILPKEEWLILHGVEADWPVCGFPHKIHVDNGPDFRSDNVKKSCELHGIHLEFRKVKVPRYGAHIERLLGTLLKEIHELPGTTFSSVQQRAEYDSDKKSALTIGEFEKWLVTLITKVYHQRIHSTLGTTPLHQWEMGIFGHGEIPGIGLPKRPAHRETIYIDFLPYFTRTIKTAGVSIDRLNYYAPCLNRHIQRSNPNKELGKKYIFRRDPRDISQIHFYDPEAKSYFKVPYADITMPKMSIWEWREILKDFKKRGIEKFDAEKVKSGLDEMRKIVDEATKKSKQARRKSQRRKAHTRKVTPDNPIPAKVEKPQIATSVATNAGALLSGDLDITDDIA